MRNKVYLDRLGDAIPCGAVQRLGTGRLRHTVGGNGTMRGLEFSEDGEFLMSADGEERLVCLWEVATGKLLHRLDLSDHGWWPRIYLSPDSRWLITIASGMPGDELAHLWDMRTGERIPWPQVDRCDLVTFSHDGRKLVGHYKGHLYVWHVRSRRLDRTLGMPETTQPFNRVLSLAISPQGLLMAARCNDLLVWEMGSSTLLHRFELRHEECVGDPTFDLALMAPDGSLLAATAWREWAVRRLTKSEYSALAKSKRDFTCRLHRGRHWLTEKRKELSVWKLPSGEPVQEAEAVGRKHRIVAWAFTKNSRSLVFVGRDVQRGRPRKARAAKDGPPADIDSWTAHGKVTISNSPIPPPAEPLFFWDVGSDTAPRSLRAAVDFQHQVALSHDSSRVVTLLTEREATAPGTPHPFDLASGQLLRGFVPPGTGQRIALSPDDNRVAVACRDGTVGMFDAATGLESFRLDRHLTTIQGLAFSADGSILVTASPGYWGCGSLCRWDLQPGRLLGRKETMVNDSCSLHLIVSKNGKYVALRDYDGTGRQQVRVFDWGGGECRIPVEADWTTAMTFFPNDRTLMLLKSGESRCFDVASGRPVPTSLRLKYDPSLNPVLPDGRLCGVQVTEDTIKVQTLVRGRFALALESSNPLRGTGSYPVLTALSSNEDRFALLSEEFVDRKCDLGIHVWDCKSGELLHTLRVPKRCEAQEPNRVALGFNPKGIPLVAFVDSGEEALPSRCRYWLSLRDVRNGMEIFGCNDPTYHETGSRDIGYHSRVAFSPDGTLLGCVCDNRVLLWKVPDLRR